jgi:tetratricopeptide (TPR) repeat protein
MKKIALVLLFIAILPAGMPFAENAAKDSSELFRQANIFYEARDYAKAIESYVSILDSGVESGNLYYNIGNSFFKLGKLGYAILCYDRAARLKPRDSDIRSNLEYARSLVDDPGYGTLQADTLSRVILLPFRAFNLGLLTLVVAALYIMTAILLVVTILYRLLGRRLRYVTAAFVIIFVYSLAAFGLRYRDEVILKHGIIIQANVEAKYEPIDKSTTYYKLNEGCEVIILKSANDWRKIKRADGKKAWVRKDAVEAI